MIVVVIVGILSAIALPNFLNQQSKAKAVCAETQVSALAKEQQIFFAENSVFAGRIGTGTGELDSTPDTACNGYTDITLSDTKNPGGAYKSKWILRHSKPEQHDRKL